MPGAPQVPPADAELDELLRPTISEQGPDRTARGRPWRLGSQMYVAFFGGALAAGVIAVLNARALGLSPSRRWAIAGIGAAGMAASLLVIALIGVGDDNDGGPPVATAARVVAVVAWGGMYLIQRTADRVYSYHARGDDPYQALWGPGIAAVIAGLVIQGALAFAILGDFA
jgi:hypothetical protein